MTLKLLLSENSSTLSSSGASDAVDIEGWGISMWLTDEGVKLFTNLARDITNEKCQDLDSRASCDATDRGASFWSSKSLIFEKEFRKWNTQEWCLLSN